MLLSNRYFRFSCLFDFTITFRRVKKKKNYLASTNGISPNRRNIDFKYLRRHYHTANCFKIRIASVITLLTNVILRHTLACL